MSGFSDSSDAFRKLRTTNINHINPSEHLSPIDYLKGMYRFFQSVNLPKRNFPISINSLDCTPLFEGAKRAFHTDTFRFLLYPELFKKIRAAGYFPKIVICEFENMIMEKMLYISSRSAFPKSKIFAYQHSVISPNFLFYIISKSELLTAPLPDKIICNGVFFYNQLNRNGFPKKILCMGPALRYKHLHSLQNKNATNIKKRWDILCLLPLMDSDCEELLLKVLKSFISENKRICLKPHPMSSTAKTFTLLKKQTDSLKKILKSLVTNL